MSTLTTEAPRTVTYSLGGQLTAAELWDSPNKSRGACSGQAYRTSYSRDGGTLISSGDTSLRNITRLHHEGFGGGGEGFFLKEMRKGGVKMDELGTLNNPGTQNLLRGPNPRSCSLHTCLKGIIPAPPTPRTDSALSSSRGEVTADREPPVTQASRSQICALQLQSQDPVLAFR